MTSDHVQDLLLDLAYGELPADRAAEVEAHLATCEVCRAERDGLVRTRALVGPLRSLEEPSAGFDERIVKSARAEAGLQADGTPGPTIEVSGSVKPLGLQAGRVDPLAAGVRVAKKEISKRTVWLRRATVGASIAGAAAVALFVASSVQQKRVDRAEEVPELKVRAPAVEGVRASNESTQAKVPQKTESGPQAPAPAPQGSGGDLAVVPPPAPPPAASSQQQLAEAPKKADAPPRRSAPPGTISKDQTEIVPYGRNARTFDQLPAAQPPPPSAAAGATEATRAAPADRSVAIPSREKAAPPETRSAPAERQRGEVQTGRQIASVPSRPEAGLAKAAAGADLDPDRLEESAGDARREGSYARAAELYQLASGIRRAKNDSSRAAWDLAHAVECLAAASKLGEASDVRGELMRSYPSEEGPLRAADRALGWPAKARR
jgi:anti-sigma factor RsiW